MMEAIVVIVVLVIVAVVGLIFIQSKTGQNEYPALTVEELDQR